MNTPPTHSLAVVYIVAYAAEMAYRESVESWGPAERAAVRPLEEDSILAHRAWRTAGFPVAGCAHDASWYRDGADGSVTFCSSCDEPVPAEMVERARLEFDLAIAIRRTLGVDGALPLLSGQLADLLQRAQFTVAPGIVPDRKWAHVATQTTVCEQLARMQTSSEMDVDGGMSGDDAVEALSGMIELARSVVMVSK